MCEEEKDDYEKIFGKDDEDDDGYKELEGQWIRIF